jgi:hypothetical protein
MPLITIVLCAPRLGGQGGQGMVSSRFSCIIKRPQKWVMSVVFDQPWGAWLSSQANEEGLTLTTLTAVKTSWLAGLPTTRA